MLGLLLSVRFHCLVTVIFFYFTNVIPVRSESRYNLFNSSDLLFGDFPSTPFLLHGKPHCIKKCRGTQQKNPTLRRKDLSEKRCNDLMCLMLSFSPWSLLPINVLIEGASSSIISKLGQHAEGSILFWRTWIFGILTNMEGRSLFNGCYAWC